MEVKGKIWMGLIGLLGTIGLVIWLANREYGELSERGYEVSLSLFSACNRQDMPRIIMIEALVEDARLAGEIEATELKWIKGIVAVAKAGNWGKATQRARQLMDAQIKPAEMLPKLD